MNFLEQKFFLLFLNTLLISLRRARGSCFDNILGEVVLKLEKTELEFGIRKDEMITFIIYHNIKKPLV